MIPLGPVEFPAWFIALYLLGIALLGAVAALPATIPLAIAGHRRAVRNRGWNAVWYWAWGTLLSLVLMGALVDAGTGRWLTAGLVDEGLGWWSVPVAWAPVLLLAVLLYPRGPRSPRPGGELGWGDMTTGQGER
jgi:hypothetical protein